MTEKVIAGRYRLEERLGRGGMSSVWAAEDLELGRRVAVKLLARDAGRERFEREARAAAALAHPNVARVFDFGESDDGPYLVLELLPGGTLEERAGNGRPLPDDETERIAAGIAAGLAHAHEHGLVHRDLKPANILFDAEDRPKIADFGIVRLAQGGTITDEGTVLGSAATIAPEQAQGERATPASDVYAFGAILFLLLTGRMPFEHDDPVTLASMHVTETPPEIAALRPDTPPRLERLATAALAKDPAERPQDGAALLAALGSPAVADTVPVIPPARDAGKRRLGLLWAAAAIVALAAAGALTALALSDDPSAPAAETTTPGLSATTSPTDVATSSEEVTDTPPGTEPGTTSTTATTETTDATETTGTTAATTGVTTTEPPPPLTEPTTTTDPPPETTTVP